MTLSLQRGYVPAGRVAPSNRRDRKITQPKTVALLIVCQLLGAMIDFGNLGLAPADGIDVARWALLMPALGLVMFLLFTERQLLQKLMSGPAGLFSLWLIWCLIGGLTWSQNPRDTLIQITSAAALFVLAFWYTDLAGTDNAARVFCSAAMIVIIVGLIIDFGPTDLKTQDFQLFPGRTPGASRFSGIAAGTNQLSMLGGITLATLSGINPKIPGGRLLQAISLSGAFVAIILSGSRTVIAGGVVALIVGASWKQTAKVRTWTLAFGVAAALITLSVISLSGTQTTFQSNRTSISSLNGRDDVWSYAQELALESPISGLGMMATNQSWEQAYLEGRTQFSAFDAHNMIMEVIIGSGFVGLALFGSSIVWVTVRAFRSDSTIAVPLLVLILVSSITEALISAPTVIFSVFGICMAIVNGKNVWAPYD